MKKILPCFLCMLVTGKVYTQTNIGGVVNTYTSVLTIGPCANRITVTDVSGFTAGNSVIIIQMQGATIDESNGASFGTITAYNGAGLWEKAIIHSVVGNEVTFTKNLLNSYLVSGKVQMILMPTYTNANVNSTLTGQSWDGSSGGVIAIEVSGTLLLNASIDANGIGFRGGAKTQVCPNSCSNLFPASSYYYAITSFRGALKGEGIAAIISNKERGKGTQANGGGGGNDHNSGGAGGGNYTIGGFGGDNTNPSGCRGNGHHGISGRALNYLSLNKLFFGGGGGAGHGNNGNSGGCPNDGDSGEGGNGGGIVIIIASTINGNGQAVNSNGLAGGIGLGDGAGGGGAGGVIFIQAASILNNLSLNANGSIGGNTNNGTDTRCYGPGGGGGAGAVISNNTFPANVTVSMTGGAPGIITQSLSACNGSSTTATSGTSTTTYLIGASIPQSNSTPSGGCGLPVTFIHFSGKEINKKIELKWSTATEAEAKHFEIERSSDRTRFVSIGRVTAAGNTSWRTDYHFTDPSPFPGLNYYRLRQVDFTGYEKFTSIIAVDYAIHALADNIYPNPVKAGEVLRVSFTDPEKNHEIRLLDLNGRTLGYWSRRSTNQAEEKITIPAGCTGIYILEIQSMGNKQVIKLAVSK